MNIISFQVTHNQLLRTTPAAQIVAGSISTHAVQFSFDEAWDTLTATAIFCAGTAKVAVRLTNPSNPIPIPHEVMAHSHVSVLVGVYGVNQAGEIVMPTCYAKVCDCVIAGADMTATTGTDPTPSIYQQWIAEVAASSTAATSAAQAAAQSEQTTTAQMAALKELIVHPPKINTSNHWLLWDEATGMYQDSGVPATGQTGSKGEKGDPGEKGERGEPGAQGAAFTYEDFTPAQLDALKVEIGADVMLDSVYGGSATGIVAQADHATTADSATPTDHASANATFGLGNWDHFGHTKLDGRMTAEHGETSGYAATPASVKTAYDKAVEAKTSADAKAHKSHASSGTTYGKGSGAQYGHLKLSNLTNNSSGVDDGTAATPLAVKTAYDLATAAMPKSGGGFTGKVTADYANQASSCVRNISVKTAAGTIVATGSISFTRK